MKKVQNEQVILWERFYAGNFERIALSPEEFDAVMEYCKCEVRSADASNDWREYGCPGEVTIYVRSALVGDDVWSKFFSDMQYGLPESAVAEGKFSAVRVDQMGKMRDYIAKEKLRHLQMWAILKSHGVDYKLCFNDDGSPTAMLDYFAFLNNTF